MNSERGSTKLDETQNTITQKIEGSSPYFPQPGDDLPVQPEGQMDAIGPWATGRVNFTPQDGLTGIRPVVNRYSITSFGTSQWRAHNQKCFKQSDEKIREAQLAVNNAKRCVEKSYREADKVQFETIDHLKNRASENYCKLNIEVPESIAGEFLQLRSKRLESDLIRDEVEEELTKVNIINNITNEVALCSEIRDLLGRIREQIEMQLTELKAAKIRMEMDWTDKTDAYDIDSHNIKLNNDSRIILWRLGATRFPAEQSTPSSYEHYTRESLTDAEAAKQRSANLRSTLDSIYKNSTKDLRDQATRVDLVLSKKIKLTEDVCIQLEKELLRCLHELANIEKSIEELRHSTRGLDCVMKVAQTQLANRLQRRNVESCRDTPQFALVEEVKLLNERTSAMLAELKRAEETQAGLVKARSDLEHEIVVKRKTLYIDKQRGQLLRSFYPTTI
ncbi:Tektin-4 [Melipona quadrifasciata]|uniref:Tektin n=1 Tax=Melipona quadrifasciata TaxID=166423 RepID=A0A0N0BJ35_9HYME|nr:Tektin-4 [Melipona quadrifasciata]